MSLYPEPLDDPAEELRRRLADLRVWHVRYHAEDRPIVVVAESLTSLAAALEELDRPEEHVLIEEVLAREVLFAGEIIDDAGELARFCGESLLMAGPASPARERLAVLCPWIRPGVRTGDGWIATDDPLAPDPNSTAPTTTAEAWREEALRAVADL